MTTKALVEAARKLIALLDNNPLVEALIAWKAAGEGVAKNLETLLNRKPGTAEANQTQVQLQEGLESVTREMKKLKPFVVQDELRRLDTALRQFYAEEPAPSGVLLHDLEEFKETYEDFIVNQTTLHAFRLLERSKKLLTQIRLHHYGASSVLRRLQLTDTEAPGTERISLWLSAETDALEFLSKMSAFAELYERLALALGISITEHPLKMVHVEVGSMWIEAVGHAAVTQLLSRILEKGLDFLTKHFRWENRYKDEPEFTRLKDAIGIAAEIKKLNPDATNGVTDEVASIIAKRLLQLLRGEPEVEVNGKKFILDARRSNLPEHTLPKQLQDKPQQTD